MRVSQLSTLLKVGTTALVVALAEQRGVPPVKLKQPVSAMKGFARDHGFRAEVETPHGTALMSALEIQHHYLASVEAWVNTGRLPGWAVRHLHRRGVWHSNRWLATPGEVFAASTGRWKRDLVNRELER